MLEYCPQVAFQECDAALTEDAIPSQNCIWDCAAVSWELNWHVLHLAVYVAEFADLYEINAIFPCLEGSASASNAAYLFRAYVGYSHGVRWEERAPFAAKRPSLKEHYRVVWRFHYERLLLGEAPDIGANLWKTDGADRYAQ